MIRDPDTNINDAMFITALNKTLNDQNVPPEVVFLFNEYVMTDKIDFDPGTSRNVSRNPYRVEDGMGIIEFYSSPVDVANPSYVDYVGGIRVAINSLAATIKILNGYINDCDFNEWVGIGAYPYRHNFHKLIAAVRHDLVYDYNALIGIRRYWKAMYKIVREHSLANQQTA